MIVKGLWVDCPPADVVREPYFGELRRHGLTEASLMYERSGPGFDERYTDRQLELAGKHARGHDVEIGMTLWPEPDRAYLDELEQRLPELLAILGAAFLDLDKESNWRRAKLRGFRTMAHAAARLLEILDAVLPTLDVRLDSNTYPFHAENGPNALIAPRARRRYGQAYSVWERDVDGEPFHVDWGDPLLGPGAMQRRTIERSRTVPGDGLIGCGLAAYDQRWPGREPEEAMRVAFDAAIAEGVRHFRWWSSRYVVGRSSNGYASRFLLELAQSV